MVGRFVAGAANRKFGADADRLDDANGMVQFRVALSSTAARVGIEQNGGFVHSSASSGLSLAHAQSRKPPGATKLTGGCFPGRICTMLARKVFRALVLFAIDVLSVHFQEEFYMKLLTAACAWLRLTILLSLTIFASAQDHTMGTPKPVTMMTGLCDLHHPVSTKNAQAQEFFDQGLRLIYAFNHAEAARSFQRAAELDPKLAVAYWGIAEAVGPNYNDPASEDRFVQAHQAIEKATSLAGDASESDQAYIAALTKRFPADPKSDLQATAKEYRDAMREVSKKFPDDLDAATLLAEAGMNLHPWGLWHTDGTPEAGTEEIVATLESVIRREPNHLGAIHYYIHAVEASRSPERALAGANRLAQLAPAAGHIVHMPAHIYIRTGDYEAAVKTNQKAAQADQAYLATSKAQGS